MVRQSGLRYAGIRAKWNIAPTLTLLGIFVLRAANFIDLFTKPLHTARVSCIDGSFANEIISHVNYLNSKYTLIIFAGTNIKNKSKEKGE